MSLRETSQAWYGSSSPLSLQSSSKAIFFLECEKKKIDKFLDTLLPYYLKTPKKPNEIILLNEN